MAVAVQDKTEVPRATWVGFVLMCVGMFMAILDVQVVSTSLPTIQGALGIEPERMSWVQTAYLIAEVIAIPLTGLLTRRLTMRRLFVIAVLVFTGASIGCAGSTGFATLIAWRLLQGFSGGTLIPAVFSAVFLLFPARLQGVATTIAGVVAVLAPTIGPIVGGWITETYSWHWLFLVNVVPGLISGAAAGWLLPVERRAGGVGGDIDLLALAALMIALAALEIGLKEAPHSSWLAPSTILWFALSICAGYAFGHRTLAAAHPIVQLRRFGDSTFTLSCILSFVLGMGLFGSVYLMPVFLAYVRGHGALEIGEIMLVTGIAQLLTAPLAVALERRLDARLLTVVGFVMFAIGLGWSCFEGLETDFAGMFWPQLIRGVAIMFCLLPPTRLALGQLSATEIPDASGLFNLMRNLGGAIGLALLDSVIYGRAPINAQAIVERLQAGDVAVLKALGVPVELFAALPSGSMDPGAEAVLAPAIHRLALAQAVNQAWGVLAMVTLLAAACVPLMRYRRLSLDSHSKVDSRPVVMRQ